MLDLSLAETINAARSYLDPNQVDCVVYHAPCNDGSGAALSAWMLRGAKAEYLRRIYHKTFVDELVKHKNVVVLDASFAHEHLQHLRSFAKKIMILDHHHSAMQNLAKESGCFFNMEHSGAILAWHYFHGLETPAPELLQLIEDRDLWRWSMRDLSEPLYYALKERVPNNDFKHFIPYLDNEKLQELIAYGKTLVQANRNWCEHAAKEAQKRTFTLPGINKQYTIMCRAVDNDRLVSELSEYLYTNNDIDFVMLWSTTAEGKYKVSFRSQSPDINVAEIAAALGGGGHKQAAGAVLHASPEQFLL